MPRNGSGVMSWPPNTNGVPGTTVSSTRYNAFLADLLQDLNAARPVTAGGTGATTAVAGNDNLNTTGADMPSAGTLNLANATGVVVNVTGTTTITSLGTVSSGAERTLIFAGSLTLTHSASLVLPTGANIQTAAGDVATFRSKGTGNWGCVSYQRANGTPLALISPTIIGDTTVTSTTAGTSRGPVIELFRDIVSAPASYLGSIVLAFKSTAGTKRMGAIFNAMVTVATDGAESVVAKVTTLIGGTFAERLFIGAGIYTPSVTGGDPGAGKFNAAEFQQNGVRLPPITEVFGIGQTLQNVLGSRSNNTAYQNTTTKPIVVTLQVVSTDGSSKQVQTSPDGVTWTPLFYIPSNASAAAAITFVVEPGRYYKTSATSINTSIWWEFR